MEGRAHGRMSNIGGNLDLQAAFPAEQTTRFHVEGNATLTLQEDTNLVLHALVSGEVSVRVLAAALIEAI